MDENFNNIPENDHQNADSNKNESDVNRTNHSENAEINNFSMDNNGKIRHSGRGTAVAARNVRLFIILGWISAGLVLLSFSFYMSLLFASAGVFLGATVSRQEKGMGTAIIITNLALIAFQLFLGLFFVAALRRMIMGY